MISRVLYRPFDESDFEPCAQIVQDAWHKDSGNEVYNFFEAAADFSCCLSVSTFSQVAVVDGRVCGIVLARTGKRNMKTSDHWAQVEHDIIHQMQQIEPELTDQYLTFIKTQVRINNWLIEQCPQTPPDEITLLAVSSSTRGLGVGSVLLDAACSHVTNQGGTSAYLFTDTDCSYKFYEHRGFKRAAAHKANLNERFCSLPRESFLYTLDLNA